MNKTVPASQVLPTALSLASEIAANCPESVQSTKKALVLSNQFGDVEEATLKHIWSEETRRSVVSENRKVGFVLSGLRFTVG